MLMRVMKQTAIAALLVAIFWRLFADRRTFLQFVVSAAAILLCVQAAGIRDYLLISIFMAIACVYNPVIPVGFSNEIWMVVSTMTAILLFTSPEILKARPRPSVLPIADRLAESESL